MDNLEEIIIQCIANNRQGQEKLYRMFYPALFTMSRRILADDHEALEALNNGMLKVFKNIAGWDGNKGAFFNWVYTIVRHAALDKIKENKKRFETDELKEIVDIGTSAEITDAIEWKEIYSLSEILPPATRCIYNFFYIDGCTIKEIAEMLELSSGTVKWHLSKAREKLKPSLINHFSK